MWKYERQNIACARRTRITAYLFAFELADLGGTGVGSGDDLDEVGLGDGAGLGRGEDGLDLNVPVGAEPGQALDGDDGADPDKGPFGGANVLFVVFGAEVDKEEDGPGDDKRPDIGVVVDEQRREQLGALDLAVVDQGSHDGRRQRTAAMGAQREQAMGTWWSNQGTRDAAGWGGREDVRQRGLTDHSRSGDDAWNRIKMG